MLNCSQFHWNCGYWLLWQPELYLKGGDRKQPFFTKLGAVSQREGACCGVLVGSSPLAKMTARKSGSRLETEIERCRSECQWDKIPELVRQLSAKLISNGKSWAGFSCRLVLCERAFNPGPTSWVLPDSGSPVAAGFSQLRTVPMVLK